MLPEPLTLNTASTKKIEALLKELRISLLKIIAKSFLMAVASTVPIVVLSGMFGLMQTSFPMIMGFVTALFIQIQYVNPKAKELNETCRADILKIIQDERNKQ